MKAYFKYICGTYVVNLYFRVAESSEHGLQIVL